MLVSAVIADGPPRRVLETVADGLAELVLPEPVLDELRRVLERKLGLDPASIDAITQLLVELAAEIPAVPEEIQGVSGDPDDDRILAAAVNRAEVLVSGDTKHLLSLGQYQTLRIMRPQEFLAGISG